MSEGEDDLMQALGAVARENDEPWEKLARSELGEAEAAALGADLPPEEQATMRALYTPLDDSVRTGIARMAPKPRRWVAPVVATFAAAAIALMVAWPRGELPEYVVELSEGAASVRGDVAASGTYRRSDRITIVVRPEQSVDESVDVAVFDGAERWNGPVDVAATGAARISGVAGDLFEVGEHTMTLIVGELPNPPPDALPAELPNTRRVVFEVTVTP